VVAVTCDSSGSVKSRRPEDQFDPFRILPRLTWLLIQRANMPSFSDFEFKNLLKEKKYDEVEAKIKEDLSHIVGNKAKFFTSGKGIYYYDPAYSVVPGKRGGVIKFMFRGSPSKWMYSFIRERNDNKSEKGDVYSEEFNDYQRAVDGLAKYLSRKKTGYLISYYRGLVNE